MLELLLLLAATLRAASSSSFLTRAGGVSSSRAGLAFLQADVSRAVQPLKSRASSIHLPLSSPLRCARRAIIVRVFWKRAPR